MTRPGHLTLAGISRVEPEPIKGSRHIASASPAGDEAAAREFVERVRAELPAAGHHAWAWRLAPDAREQRAVDDGEPSGTAGRPILRQLELRELFDCVVVVSRIFGGVKLGAGGLVRAYGGAAAALLDAAETVAVVPHVSTCIEVGYADEALARAALQAVVARDVGVTHAARVMFEAQVAVDRIRELEDTLREGTRGRAVFTADS